MSTESKRYGWSVSINRKDGSGYLCASDRGILPPVWTLSQRRFAVSHKRALIEAGFKAKVVRVEFTVPLEVQP
ncbi:hypothetical protein [Paucibacter sp. Y2R2-4]|uniref:hypothetical protein n=1 Tax=Paucibacter sp. Y2R2-4 TaxID=2893553 RepID=UPI0021E48BAC|nr:hypothetical protein [Paucibacter sp. Y2R2-4]MCV2349313.1 hypothetical protein [Paucibacter sp. Y2R2-4]